MVIPTHDKSAKRGYPRPGTPGQEAAQEILWLATLDTGAERDPLDRANLESGMARALEDLARSHAEDDETGPDDLLTIQSCITLLVARSLEEIQDHGTIGDRTGTLLERLAIMAQPGSWYTAGIARKILAELSPEGVPA